MKKNLLLLPIVALMGLGMLASCKKTELKDLKKEANYKTGTTTTQSTTTCTPTNSSHSGCPGSSGNSSSSGS